MSSQRTIPPRSMGLLFRRQFQNKITPAYEWKEFSTKLNFLWHFTSLFIAILFHPVHKDYLNFPDEWEYPKDSHSKDNNGHGRFLSNTSFPFETTSLNVPNCVMFLFEVSRWLLSCTALEWAKSTHQPTCLWDGLLPALIKISFAILRKRALPRSFVE